MCDIFHPRYLVPHFPVLHFHASLTVLFIDFYPVLCACSLLTQFRAVAKTALFCRAHEALHRDSKNYCVKHNYLLTYLLTYREYSNQDRHSMPVVAMTILKVFCVHIVNVAYA